MARAIIDREHIVLGADAVAGQGGDAFDEAIPPSFEITAAAAAGATSAARTVTKAPLSMGAVRPEIESHRYGRRVIIEEAVLAAGSANAIKAARAAAPVSNRMSRRLLCTRRGCLCVRGAPRAMHPAGAPASAQYSLGRKMTLF